MSPLRGLAMRSYIIQKKTILVPHSHFFGTKAFTQPLIPLKKSWLSSPRALTNTLWGNVAWRWRQGPWWHDHVYLDLHGSTENWYGGEILTSLALENDLSRWPCQLKLEHVIKVQRIVRDEGTHESCQVKNKTLNMGWSLRRLRNCYQGTWEQAGPLCYSWAKRGLKSRSEWRQRGVGHRRRIRVRTCYTNPTIQDSGPWSTRLA